MTKYPIRITEEPATWRPSGGLYVTVRHRSSRYWIGPARGPAAHIHHRQAAQLAAALTQADRAARPPTQKRPVR